MAEQVGVDGFCVGHTDTVDRVTNSWVLGEDVQRKEEEDRWRDFFPLVGLMVTIEENV